MTNDPIEEARRMLHEAAPKAARIFLADYTGRVDQPVPDLVVAALDRLPEKGRIRLKRDRRAIKAISWLLDEVPDSDPLKAEIVERFRDALSRGS